MVSMQREVAPSGAVYSVVSGIVVFLVISVWAHDDRASLSTALLVGGGLGAAVMLWSLLVGRYVRVLFDVREVGTSRMADELSKRWWRRRGEKQGYAVYRKWLDPGRSLYVAEKEGLLVVEGPRDVLKRVLKALGPDERGGDARVYRDANAGEFAE